MTHNSENDNYSFCHYPGMQYFQVHLSAGAMCSLNIVLAFWDYNFSVLSGFNTIILGGERETKEVKWGVKICWFFLSSLYHWYQEHHPFNSSQWAPNSWSFCLFSTLPSYCTILDNFTSFRVLPWYHSQRPRLPFSVSPWLCAHFFHLSAHVYL